MFAVDVAAYAVMSNHYHQVVKLSPDEVEPWSMDEVLARWCSFYEALLSCMTYVDLNPIRAAMAETPETSQHTSIKERIHPTFDFAEAIARQTEQQALNEFSVPLKPLLGFEGVIRSGVQRGILFSFGDYLELVDCTGRISRSDKRGAIDEKALPILERLNLDPERWCHRGTAFEDSYQDYRNPCRRRRAA
ncbi:hypothetical protein [Marinobacter sp. NSM]|uniref:hypothetical protein n=1 Tax=Marinobacter sp. NSM TaxID=3458004 RepID=UPI004036FC7F